MHIKMSNFIAFGLFQLTIIILSTQDMMDSFGMKIKFLMMISETARCTTFQDDDNDEGDKLSIFSSGMLTRVSVGGGGSFFVFA